MKNVRSSQSQKRNAERSNTNHPSQPIITPQNKHQKYNIFQSLPKGCSVCLRNLSSPPFRLTCSATFPHRDVDVADSGNRGGPTGLGPGETPVHVTKIRGKLKIEQGFIQHSYHPCIIYIYLYMNVFLIVNLGKYTSPMDPIGTSRIIYRHTLLDTGHDATFPIAFFTAGTSPMSFRACLLGDIRQNHANMKDVEWWIYQVLLQTRFSASKQYNTGCCSWNMTCLRNCVWC